MKYNPAPEFTGFDNQITNKIFNGTKLSVQLIMLYGNFDIMRFKNTFGVVKDDELYCVCEVEPFKNNIYKLIKIESRRNETTLNMAAALFHYLVMDLKLNLLSDEPMSTCAIRFWNEMRKRGQLSVCIYDVSDGETYIPSEPQRFTRGEPKVVVQMPECDRLIDIDKYGNELIRNHHRFFWLAQYPFDGSHYLLEYIKKGYDPEYVLFGGQQYPEY